MQPEVREVEITEIVRLEELQFRRLDQGNVRSCVEAYKAEADMPPVQTVRFNGVLYLVDGWHRVAALEQIGCDTVDATITEVATLEDAKWLAARANLGHGLPLSRKQVREAFRVFMRSGQWRRNKRRHMSLRDIGTELRKPPTTIRNWLLKDFPKIAREHYVVGSEKRSEKWGGHRGGRSVLAPVAIALTKADELLAAFKGINHPEERGAIIGRIKELEGEMKRSEWREPEPEDF